MQKDENLKYTCLFGGGAVRGAAHVGVLKAFEQFGICCDTYGGSSVGSIIAVMRALGYSVNEIEEVFLGVNFELFRDISFGFNTKFALSKGGVFLDWIREIIEKKFYGEEYKKGENEPVKFKDIDKKLVILSTDLKNFNCQEFSTGKTPDFEIAMAVRISCCAPGLMKPVNLDDKLLVDGDLLRGKPMWSLSDCLNCADSRIIEIRLEGEYSGEDSSPLDFVNAMYSCMTSCESNFIQSLYCDNDMYDYIVLNTGDTVVLDFNTPAEKRKKIIASGYNQTVEYFSKILPNKKRALYGVYVQILDHIRKVQEFILQKKYQAAKNRISELFILLCDVKNKIDINIYNEISKYQQILFSSVKSGLLGLSRCDNIDLVRAQQILLIEMLSKKVKELESYLGI